MYLYFDYNGKLKTVIPHGEPVRQGATLHISVCFPIDFWEYLKQNRTDLTTTDPLDYYKTITIIDTTGQQLGNPKMLDGDMEVEVFHKLYDCEMTYDLVDGDSYLVYKVVYTPEEATIKNGTIGAVVEFYRPTNIIYTYNLASGTFQSGIEYFTQHTDVSGTIYYLMIQYPPIGENIPSDVYTRTSEETGDEITIVNGRADIFVEKTVGEAIQKLDKDIVVKYATILNEIARLDVKKQNRLDDDQLNAVNSGITADKVKSYDEHLEDKSNPHEVTKEQVGLGNVDNTSDSDKPISTATQTAIDKIKYVLKRNVLSDNTINITLEKL